MQVATSQVAVFWDYENCQVPSNMSGYEIVANIRDTAHAFGSIKSFKAYAQFPEQNSLRSLCLRSELQSSGVSMIDCPHNGRKNVADQMIIADMLAFAMDNPSPSITTIMLISGDRDFAYALSLLRLRMYSVVVVALPGAHASLKVQATSFFDWTTFTADSTNSEQPLFDHRDTTPVLDSFRFKSNFPTPASQTMKSPSWRTIYSPSHPNPFSPKPDSRKQGPSQGVTSVSQKASPPSPTQPSHYAPVKKSLSLPFLKDEKSTTYIAPISTDTKVAAMPHPLVETGSDAQAVYTSLEPNPALSPLESVSTIAAVDVALSRRDTYSSADPLIPSSTSDSAASSAPAPTSEPSVGQALEPSPIAPDMWERPTLRKTTDPKHIPPKFQRLVQLLESYRLNGTHRPLRSLVALELVSQDPNVYKSAGATKFSHYSVMAADQGLVALGGKGGGAWVSLHPELYGKL